MSAPLVIPANTIEAQHRASDPRATVWVSANAGSGKTHVLTQRVVRLLLEGVPPARILCLTYTKAAAANMAQRVCDTLSKWTVLDDAGLTRAILDTGADFSRAQLVAARRLFARTVETPGGLKIQTIHAFCERLLHQFPFEANLPSRFVLLEDRQKAEMLAAARHGALAQAIAAPESVLGRAVAILSASNSEATLNDVLDEALGKRRELVALARQVSAVGKYRDYLASWFNLSPSQTRAEIERAILEDGIAPSQWADLANRLDKGSANDKQLAKTCRRALLLEGAARLEHWLKIFFTDDGKPRGGAEGKIITKTATRADPTLLDDMLAEQDRLVRLVELRKAAVIVENSTAMLTLADHVMNAYQAAKNARAMVDFDDLIDKTFNLLSRSDAGWVLYKLDAGIDHILVDEAQDTSPEQWEILRILAEEFSSGKGARPATRTLFAVGDEKQSIYSFQGARPAKFAQMRAHFQQRVGAADGEFREIRLHESFRSAPGVLTTVDAIFRSPENRKGLSADNLESPHVALKHGLPSLVEVWPLVTKRADDPPLGWKMPLDVVDPGAPAMRVANEVAKLVSGWLAPGSQERVMDSATGTPRRVRAGDVIVLVRTRSAFFEAVIRAFKEQRVPVAGADRLKFVEHIAVMDLIAAGRASLLPQDDLTLACLLTSPLIGLDDDDLIALAPRRPASLAQALEASPQAPHRAAAARLAQWRVRAREMTPFMFYAHILGADGGRRDLVARLGAEAGDAIDEFLNQALQHERNAPPSLAAFLAILESVEGDVKRDMDAAGDAVRVMTIHAAKGLESKIVILPDTCSVPSGSQGPKIFTLAAADNNAGALVWSPRKEEDTEIVAAARQAAHDLVEDEYRRLLYVALTRAEERLYVMGFHGDKKPAENCWYNMISGALMDGLTPTTGSGAEQIVLRRVEGAFTADLHAIPQSDAPQPADDMPDWLTREARPERDGLPPVRPSTALAAADSRRDYAGVANLGEAARLGKCMHALLQHLPCVASADRQAAAQRFLTLRAPWLDESGRALLVARASAVLALPELALLFSPDARAEVAIAGSVKTAKGRVIDIVGQIDRLVVTQTEVLIADFKTGAPRPAEAIPANYVLQLALYAAALTQAYPEKKVRALLVWIDGPQVVEPGEENLAAAPDHAPIN